MHRQTVRIFTLKFRCNENVFITDYGSDNDNHRASGFMPGRLPRRNGHGDGWQRRILLYAFIGNDSPRRHGQMDLELDRSQYHVRYSGPPERTLGFGSSRSGSYVHAHIQRCWVVFVLLHSAWVVLQHGRHGDCIECSTNTYAYSPSTAARRRYSDSSRL